MPAAWGGLRAVGAFGSLLAGDPNPALRALGLIKNTSNDLDVEVTVRDRRSGEASRNVGTE